MPEYRAYVIGKDDHIQSFETLVVADDDAAIATVKRLVDGHDVELWQADRMVKRLAHKAGSNTVG
jgi:hypothetical protein